MPDRELPEQLKAKLAAALAAGTPLKSPLPSQARYADATGADAQRPRVRPRLVALAVASVVMLGVLAFAGPSQPRQWLVQSVGSIARDVGAPVGAPSPSSSGQRPGDSSPGPSHEATETPEAAETPEGSETPEANASPEPGGTPESSESPEPTQSPDGDGSSGGDGGGDHSSTSPSPSPSDGGSDGGH